MNPGEADGLEDTENLTELADVDEGLRTPHPHQGLAAFGFEKIDLLRINGDASPILQVQQNAIVKTTMIYTHVLNRFGGKGVVSPADALGVGAPERTRAIDHPSCDIAEQAIEHPTDAGVQLTDESMSQDQRKSSMPEIGNTESSNSPPILFAGA